QLAAAHVRAHADGVAAEGVLDLAVERVDEEVRGDGGGQVQLDRAGMVDELEVARRREVSVEADGALDGLEASALVGAAGDRDVAGHGGDARAPRAAGE